MRKPKPKNGMFGIKKLAAEVHQIHHDVHEHLVSKRDLREAEQRLSDLIKSGASPGQVRFDWTVGPVENKTKG